MNIQRDNIISLYCTDEFPGGRYLHPSLAGFCSSTGAKSRFDDAIGMAALAIQKVLDAMNETQNGNTNPDKPWEMELPYQAIKARDIALRITHECGVSLEILYAEAVARCGCTTPFKCDAVVLRLIS